ncbi:MAG TPA: TonB family protein [Pyrinomonadaceae bacterium]|jgi:TonB family protein
MKKIVFLFLFAVCFVSELEAQKQNSPKSSEKSAERTVPQVCGGGVLNAKAILLPKPAYPKAAKKANVSGTVTVQVKIDKAGNVIEAKACSGNPLLRKSAVEAAGQAKINPTILSGTAVNVSGILVYYFASEEASGEYFEIPCETAKIYQTFILNNKAIFLAKPEYPQELKADGITGSVSVWVALDERGKVVSASAFSGHSELRKHALEAVKKSKFKRIIRCGAPIKINGMVIFNFAP